MDAVDRTPLLLALDGYFASELSADPAERELRRLALREAATAAGEPFVTIERECRVLGSTGVLARRIRDVIEADARLAPLVARFDLGVELFLGVYVVVNEGDGRPLWIARVDDLAALAEASTLRELRAQARRPEDVLCGFVVLAWRARHQAPGRWAHLEHEQSVIAGGAP